MKKILDWAILTLLLAFPGCATLADVQRANLECRTEIMREILARDKHERMLDYRISKTESDIEDIDILNLRPRLWKTEASISDLKAFRADHDKRWPPPVKLKIKK